jgi:hypothetical protein
MAEGRAELTRLYGVQRVRDAHSEGSKWWSRRGCSSPFEENRRKTAKVQRLLQLADSPMSLRNPLRFFGHPHIALYWQQLATVGSGTV